MFLLSLCSTKVNDEIILGELTLSVKSLFFGCLHKCLSRQDWLDVVSHLQVVTNGIVILLILKQRPKTSCGLVLGQANIVFEEDIPL